MPNVEVVMGAGFKSRLLGGLWVGGNDAKNPYICGIFDLSQMGVFGTNGLSIDSKHHVAMFSPVLDADSTKYVHHMILYACDSHAAGLSDGLEGSDEKGCMQYAVE